MPPIDPCVPLVAVPLLAVIVPVRNEAENILPLVAEISAALAAVPHEIIYVDDGSSDATPDRLAEAQCRTPALRWLRHRASCGQSAAIVTGIRAARAPFIATLDGDGQNDPADIVRLLDRARQEAATTLIAGHRVNRRDSRVKRLSSRIANRTRAALLGDDTADTGCGLKVFARETFLRLPAFDHVHRFLPALFIREGGRVISLPVSHRARRHGASNYGTFDRLWVGLVDIAGVIWLQRRWRRPVLGAVVPIEEPVVHAVREPAIAAQDG